MFFGSSATVEGWIMENKHICIFNIRRAKNRVVEQFSELINQHFRKHITSQEMISGKTDFKLELVVFEKADYEEKMRLIRFNLSAQDYLFIKRTLESEL